MQPPPQLLPPEGAGAGEGDGTGDGTGEGTGDGTGGGNGDGVGDWPLKGRPPLDGAGAKGTGV